MKKFKLKSLLFFGVLLGMFACSNKENDFESAILKNSQQQEEEQNKPLGYFDICEVKTKSGKIVQLAMTKGENVFSSASNVKAIGNYEDNSKKYWVKGDRVILMYHTKANEEKLHFCRIIYQGEGTWSVEEGKSGEVEFEGLPDSVYADDQNAAYYAPAYNIIGVEGQQPIFSPVSKEETFKYQFISSKYNDGATPISYMNDR